MTQNCFIVLAILAILKYMERDISNDIDLNDVFNIYTGIIDNWNNRF